MSTLKQIRETLLRKASSVSTREEMIRIVGRKMMREFDDILREYWEVMSDMGYSSEEFK